jgi:type IV pilus assembly protein PilM
VKLSLPRLRFNSRSVVGLDVGSSAIKAVELTMKGRSGGFELSHLGVANVPAEAIVQGAFLNASAITEAIREAIDNGKIKTKNVAAAVSGHSVIVKKVNLPAMSREELDEQIRWEAEQYIPFDVNEVNLDFQILGGGNDDGQMEVLLVAAKKDLIDDYVQVIHEAGLVPVAIDVAAFAVENAFEANYDASPGQTVALVNIGAQVVNINIVSNGVPVLHPRHHHRGQPVHRGDPEGALDQLQRSRAHQARRPPHRQPGRGAAGSRAGGAERDRDGDRRDQPLARLLRRDQRRQPDREGLPRRRRLEGVRIRQGVPRAHRPRGGRAESAQPDDPVEPLRGRLPRRPRAGALGRSGTRPARGGPMIQINLLPVREAKRKADVKQNVLELVFALIVVGAAIYYVHSDLTTQIDTAQNRITRCRTTSRSSSRSSTRSRRSAPRRPSCRRRST